MRVASLRPLIWLALWAVTQTTSAEHSDSESFDLEVVLRERATFLSSLEWDEENEDSGWFWTQRLTATGVWQGESVGGKVTVLSAWQEGLHPNPIEENQLDVHEAYIDLALPAAALGNSSLRLGRQEIRLGSQRLVGVRDGTSVRRTWDGARYTSREFGWQIDAFYGQEVLVEPEGVFNDSSKGGRALTGIYATGSTELTGVDAYYLVSIRDDRNTIEGAANQRRHTVGTRLFGDSGPLFWNWEAAYQFGDHGDLDIRAWTLATNTGYRFEAPWEPAIMLSINTASGDETRGDGRLETFDALYPRGSYFSEIAQLGPSNFYNFNPYLLLSPREDMEVSLEVDWFWRRELNDGVYGPPGNIVREPGGSRERLVSTAFSGVLEWEYSEKILLAVVATYSIAEDFIEETGPHDNASFFEFSFEYEL